MTNPSDCTLAISGSIVTPDGQQYALFIDSRGKLRHGIPRAISPDFEAAYNGQDAFFQPASESQNSQLRVLMAAHLQQLADTLMAADPEPAQT